MLSVGRPWIFILIVLVLVGSLKVETSRLYAAINNDLNVDTQNKPILRSWLMRFRSGVLFMRSIPLLRSSG